MTQDREEKVMQESEEMRCPMARAVTVWDESGEVVGYDTERCDEPLFFERTWVSDMMVGSKAKDFEGEGNYSHWRVVCVGQHVLLRDGGDPDNPQKFTQGMLDQLQRPTPRS